MQIYASLSQVTNISLIKELLRNTFNYKQVQDQVNLLKDQKQINQFQLINQSSVEQPQQSNRIKVQHIQTNLASKEKETHYNRDPFNYQLINQFKLSTTREIYRELTELS